MLFPGRVLLDDRLQRGIDVAVTIRTPDGEVGIEIDSPNGTEGPEPVLFVVRVQGSHRIAVRPLEPNVPAGHYDLRLEPVRKATTRDRQAVDGLRLHAEGMRLRNEGLHQQGVGEYRVSKDRYDRAEATATRALRLRQDAVGPAHPDVAATHELLGLIYDEVGEYARGERHFATALGILERRLGAGHPGLLTTQSDLGFLKLAAGDYPGAETLFLKTVT